MADSHPEKKDKKQDNPYNSSVNRWVLWTAIALIIFVILLLVFNRRSTVINEEAESDSPIALLAINSQKYFTKSLL